MGEGEGGGGGHWEKKQPPPGQKKVPRSTGPGGGTFLCPGRGCLGRGTFLCPGRGGVGGYLTTNDSTSHDTKRATYGNKGKTLNAEVSLYRINLGSIIYILSECCYEEK